jgi:hypothetical protein
MFDDFIVYYDISMGVLIDGKVHTFSLTGLYYFFVLGKTF